ncbi:hypothetical protein V1512DRAFT_259015 [Lipomyces arxii]|uniref:uncharacterized protein n=1 Tax=Lipomyces arxii TaxID=56418 RepID=UPI0034CD358F
MIMIPSHHTLLFRLRLFNDPVHTPIFSCTLSKTTGLPILTDPINSVLKITNGTGVAILIDGHAVRTREQVNRLISLGRFGKRPAALPIARDSALKLVSSKKKMPIFDVLYLEQDEDDEEDLPIYASSSASSLSSISSSSSCSTSSSSSSTTPSLLRRLGLRRVNSPKPMRKYVSSYPDMEGGSALDTEFLLRQASIPLPHSLRLQVRDATVRLQQLELQNRALSSTLRPQPSSYSQSGIADRRKAIVFSVGIDDLDEPLFWEDERGDDLMSLYGGHDTIPAMLNNPADALRRQQSLRTQQFGAGHRRQCSGSSFASLRLARIYEEDEEN